MSKFKKDGRGSSPEMNTASLPDIVFMLLFFFMVATTSKETDPTVKVTQPEGQKAVDLTPYKQRSEIDFLYIGPPKNRSRISDFTDGIALSLDNVVKSPKPDGLYTVDWVASWKQAKYNSKNKQTMNKAIGDVITCVKSDVSTPSGFIFDIREALESVDALTIAYAVKDNSIGFD